VIPNEEVRAKCGRRQSPGPMRSCARPMGHPFYSRGSYVRTMHICACIWKRRPLPRKKIVQKRWSTTSHYCREPATGDYLNVSDQTPARTV
jgi:hypothetical protein